MSDMDDKILAAFQAETEKSMGDYSKELGPFGLTIESFKGAFRWIVGIAFILILVFIGVGIFCAINFLNATDVAIKLNWFAGSLLAFTIVTVLRLWFFMELNRLSIKREIKRVEIQVSLIGARLDDLSKR